MRGLFSYLVNQKQQFCFSKNAIYKKYIFTQAMKKRQNLYRAEPAYRISSNPLDIMYEIMTNGPVQGKKLF